MQLTMLLTLVLLFDYETISICLKHKQTLWTGLFIGAVYKIFTLNIKQDDGLSSAAWNTMANSKSLRW